MDYCAKNIQFDFDQTVMSFMRRKIVWQIANQTLLDEI
jgi:hypothetical protein